MRAKAIEKRLEVPGKLTIHATIDNVIVIDSTQANNYTVALAYDWIALVH